MNLPLLNIQSLSINFKTENGLFPALKEISFTVDRGETVAIVGESGSGKSVTSLSILQLLASPPAVYAGGKILFSPDGITQKDILKLPTPSLRQMRGNEIAMIFQEPMTSLNPVFTCGDQVMEAIRLHQQTSDAEAKKRTIELFGDVKLPTPELIFNRYPHQLSGGQKQRVMIAMAMSCNPSLLIADEPTTALDVTVQKNIMQLIKELQLQHHMGVIFITHDLALVSEVADRVIVVYKGRIVESGKLDTILKNPVHPYTRALLACRPALHPKGERLPVVSDFMEWDERGEVREKINTTTKQLLTSETTSIVKAGKPLLEVEDLEVRFPSRKSFFGKTLTHLKAVDRVSFHVYEGETLGLVGESGSGKTTLGRSLLRLIQPHSGKIMYKGEDLMKCTPQRLRALRKHMQIIFQDPFSSLNPRMTIGDAIAGPMRLHHIGKSDAERRSLVEALLEKVNLKPEFFHRYPHEFSGGQRQRIVIARALALRPGFIICDESVSSLDVSVQAQVLNLLNDLKKEFQFTAVFISHDLSVVRYISDRIMVMNKGRIEEIGDAEQVYHHPVSEYTQRLISSIPKGLVAH